jgi:superfamily II DNA or RNA helicase
MATKGGSLLAYVNAKRNATSSSNDSNSNALFGNGRKRSRMVQVGENKRMDIRTLFAKQNCVAPAKRRVSDPYGACEYEYATSIASPAPSCNGANAIKRFKTTVGDKFEKCAEGTERLRAESLAPHPARESKDPKKKPPYNPQELQFVYQKLNDDDEEVSFVACTPTHAMKLVGPFDFEDYRRETRSPPFPPMLQKLIQRAIDFEVNPRSVPAYDLRHFSGTLRKKQVTALEFILTRAPLPVILALGTGLGKTAVAYAYIALLWDQILQHESDARILVVVPANVRPQWVKEGREQFFTVHGASIGMIPASKDADKTLEDSAKRIVIVGYSMLKSLEAKLVTKRWVALICDEAHNMQSKTAQCSKVIERLRPLIEHNRLVLLTATPADKPTYWNLLRICDPEIFASFFHHRPAKFNWPRSDTIFHFAEWYAMAERLYIAGGATRWEFKRMLRRHELHALTKHFILRQKKEEVMLDVAPLCMQKVVVGKASLEEKAAFEDRMSAISEASEKKGHVYAKAMLLEQVRDTALNKVPFVLAYAHRLLESSPSLKFILWAYSKNVMEAIAADFVQKGIKHILVNGDTPSKQRESLFEAFKTDPSVRVAVLSLDACGTGLNFTYVQLCVYAELTFRYKSHIQSEGRCHRIGQKGQAIVQYLIYDDSTDGMVWNCLQRKRDNESILLENEKSANKVESLKMTEAVHFVAKHERLLQIKLGNVVPVDADDDEDEEEELTAAQDQEVDEADNADEQQGEGACVVQEYAEQHEDIDEPPVGYSDNDDEPGGIGAYSDNEEEPVGPESLLDDLDGSMFTSLFVKQETN